jgi:hypothetical protein
MYVHVCVCVCARVLGLVGLSVHWPRPPATSPGLMFFCFGVCLIVSTRWIIVWGVCLFGCLVGWCLFRCLVGWLVGLFLSLYINVIHTCTIQNKNAETPHSCCIHTHTHVYTHTHTHIYIYICMYVHLYIYIYIYIYI